MATYTNVGLTLLATALQTSGANVAITYVALGTGCGTLASALTGGQAYTVLLLAAGLPAPLANGQSLTIVDATGDTQIVTCTGNNAGDIAIAVQSFTASANFAVGSGVTTTPGATDNALFNEQTRVEANTGTAGANPGESLNSGYVDPSAPSGTYVEVGYYGGSTATGAAGSGILMARDIQYWAHTYNVDSAQFQLDSTISLA